MMGREQETPESQVKKRRRKAQVPGSATILDIVPEYEGSNLKMEDLLGSNRQIRSSLKRFRKSTSTAIIAMSTVVALCFFIFLLVLSLVVIYVLLLKETTYCDNEIESRSYFSGCIPCPENAKCKDGGIECSEDFLLNKNGECVQSEGIVELSYYLRGRIERYCGEVSGEFECGLAPSKSVIETDLKQYLHPLFHDYIATQELTDKSLSSKFDKCFDEAVYSLKELDPAERKVTVEEGQTVDPSLARPEHLFSSKVSRRPLGCVVRNLALQLAPLIVVFIGISVLGGVIAIILHIRNRKTRRVDAIVGDIRVLLKTKLTKKDEAGAWIPVSQIRDQVLRPGERTLWKDVKKAIELDSRIEQMPRRLHSGKQEVTWQWCSSLPM